MTKQATKLDTEASVKSLFNTKAAKDYTRDLVKDMAWSAVVGGVSGVAVAGFVLGAVLLTTGVMPGLLGVGMLMGIGAAQATNTGGDIFLKEREKRKTEQAAKPPRP